MSSGPIFKRLVTAVSLSVLSVVSVARAHPSRTALSMAWRSSSDTNDGLIDNLVENDIISGGVNSRVALAMRQVDRKHYVTDPDTAYIDSPQTIGYRATISAPHMHAMCVELLKDQLQPGAEALDVGSGSGYLTAVMAKMVEPDGHVYGVEHVEPLVQWSRENLAKGNPDLEETGLVSFSTSDGRMGLPDHGPFDAIHVGAAAPEIPAALIDQLAPQGRMIIPVGPAGQNQELMQVDKDANGEVTESRICGVVYVPLTGLQEQWS